MLKIGIFAEKMACGGKIAPSPAAIFASGKSHFANGSIVANSRKWHFGLKLGHIYDC